MVSTPTKKEATHCQRQEKEIPIQHVAYQKYHQLYYNWLGLYSTARRYQVQVRTGDIYKTLSVWPIVFVYTTELSP